MVKSKKSAASAVDAARSAKMYLICQIDRFGEIDGIEFDFRNESLPPHEWWTVPLQVRLGQIQDIRRPFIWYPWYGSFDEAPLRREAEAYFRVSGQKPSKADFESYVSARKPDVVVHRGDKICVYRIDVDRKDVAFEHAHDVEVRRLFLCVHRENGDVEPIAVPLQFYGAFALMGPGARNDALETVRNRILDSLRLEAPDSDVDASGEPSLALEALRLARLLEEHTGHLRDLAEGIPLLPNGRPDRPDERIAAMKTMDLVNVAIRLGYFWAKAEAEHDMKPKANSALRSKAGASRGGARSGESRRNKRADGWERVVLRLAEDFRTKNPSASQDAIVDEVKSVWPKAPGRTTLKGFISRMENAGKLQKRDPSYSVNEGP